MHKFAIFQSEIKRNSLIAYSKYKPFYLQVLFYALHEKPNNFEEF